MKIGMDDPTLAPRLTDTALDADRTVPMLPYVAAEIRPGDLAAPPDPEGRAPVLALEGEAGESPAPDEALPVEIVAGESADTTRNPAREWRVTLLFGVAGAAAGYYASTVWNLDMWQSTAGMAGAWLLLAWIWVRWVARRQ